MAGGRSLSGASAGDPPGAGEGGQAVARSWGRGETGEQHQGHLPGLYTCTQINEYQILLKIHCQGD